VKATFITINSGTNVITGMLMRGRALKDGTQFNTCIYAVHGNRTDIFGIIISCVPKILCLTTAMSSINTIYITTIVASAEVGAPLGVSAALSSPALLRIPHPTFDNSLLALQVPMPCGGL
jgi:hypothetical protein